MVCAAIGQAIGSMAGRHLRRALLVLGPLRLFDNVGGGVLGAVTGLALCWAVGAVLLYLPRQTELRHYAQDSTILSKLNQELPPHRLIDTLAQIDPFTTLAGPAAGVDAPDPAVLDSAGVSGAALSVVRVVGTACGLGIEGSGWVAGPGLVVTNAHVVAGIGTPRVDRNDGELLDAQRRLVRPGQRHRRPARRRASRARALPLADAVPGTPAGAARLPGQRPVHRDRRPCRPDRADRRPRRVRELPGHAGSVTTIRGSIRSGNSGGPVVDAQGRVITTVFAQRVGTDGGYGVPTDIVRAAIAAAGVKPLETPCADR